MCSIGCINTVSEERHSLIMEHENYQSNSKYKAKENSSGSVSQNASKMIQGHSSHSRRSALDGLRRDLAKNAKTGVSVQYEKNKYSFDNLHLDNLHSEALPQDHTGDCSRNKNKVAEKNIGNIENSGKILSDLTVIDSVSDGLSYLEHGDEHQSNGVNGGYDESEDEYFLISSNEKSEKSEEFAASVENLVADDISTEVKKKKKRFVGQIVRRALMVVFVAIFIGSSARLVYIIYDHYKAEQAYSDIDAELEKISLRRLLPESSGMAMFTLKAAQSSDAIDVNNGASDYYEYLRQMKAKINYLREKNSDIVGYINVPNTKIDYPILHCEDNEYYLNHDFLGNYRLAGAIFMDFRNTSDFSSNYNTCIYGHNLSNGNMMNNITLFRDETFFNENEYVEITSTDGLYIYQVFSIYKTDMYNNYIDTYFSTPEAFVDFAYEMKSRSMYQREGVEFTSSDRLLTLSTCTNIIQEERYTLQAKLIRIER